MSQRPETTQVFLESPSVWDQFWFSSPDSRRIGMVRVALAAIAAIYFVSQFADLEFWFASDGLLSTSRVASFVRVGGFQDAAKWITSPLFLAESLWVYQIYLGFGVVVALVVASGRGGWPTAALLWCWFVGWANRLMILSGLGETLLSLALFAVVITSARPEWVRGFGQRLMATQITVIGLATLVTMLAGRIWFSGIGAYALAAPAPDRTIDWTTTILVRPGVHELLTHAMVAALPIGFALAWIARTHRIGQVVLLAWCAVVAMLGSHWMYAATFAAMTLAIEPIGNVDDRADQGN